MSVFNHLLSSLHHPPLTLQPQASEQLPVMTAAFSSSFLTAGRLRMWSWWRPPSPGSAGTHRCSFTATSRPNISPGQLSYVYPYSVCPPFDRTQLTLRQLHHVLDRILSRVPLASDWNTQQNLRTCACWALSSLYLPLSHSQNYEHTSATDNLQNNQLRSLTYLLRREFLHRGSCRVLHSVA